MLKENLPPHVFVFDSPRNKIKTFNVDLTDLPNVPMSLKIAPASPLKKYKKKDDPYPYKDIFKNEYDNTPFLMLFFSRLNINEIQTRIRNEVLRLSTEKYLIDEQDETNLVVVMRSIYQKYGRSENDPKYFKESINYLNDIVVKETVPSIINSIKSHIKYLEFVSKPYGGSENLLPQPQAVSISGTKNYNL